MELFCIGKSLVPFFVICNVVVVCDIINPVNLQGETSGNASFLWNTTTGTAILEAKWGIYDSIADDAQPYFIKVSKSDGVEFSTDLDNVASSYKDRVHFIGNISQGRAWFVLTKLSPDDTKNYSANIKEPGKSFRTYAVNMTVIEATTPPPTNTPRTTKPSSKTVSTMTAKPSSKTVSTRPTAAPTTPHPGPDPTVTIIIVIVVIIIFCFGVILCCVYCCNDIWKKFIGCCGCRKKDCCCYHCCQRCRCGPPWCPAEP